MNLGDKQKKPAIINQPSKRMATGQGQNSKDLKPYVEVKLVTWNKDSHGLFDYESKSVDLKFIKIETPCEIYRLKKEPAPDGSKEKEEFKLLDSPIEQNNKENLTNKNSVFLASVDVNEGGQRGAQFQFNAFRDSLGTFNENQQQQESYLIVRSLKNEKNVQKGYELKIGDIVKFGRIEYQVIQVRNAKEQAQIRNIQKQIHYQDEQMINESQQRQCKICLGEEETADNFFCNPCDCKGSCEYVHFECLKNWIQSKVKQKKADNTIVYSWKKSDCELCKKPLPKHVNYHNKLNDLLDIEIPEDKPYIILESIAKEKKVVKTLFIFSTDVEDKEIKLGRGHQCEVRISDISVSRTHSMIKYKDGKFTIFDNNSKFGTLIKINENLDIVSDKKAVQIGRTVITFAQKMGSVGGGNQFQERSETQKINSHHHHHHNHNFQNGLNGVPNGPIGPHNQPLPNGSSNIGSQTNIPVNGQNGVNNFNNGYYNNGFYGNIQQSVQQFSSADNAHFYLQQLQNQGQIVNQIGNQQIQQQNANMYSIPTQYQNNTYPAYQPGSDQTVLKQSNKSNRQQ
ncbi:hypothetical protein ABPG73_000909 [Tetrahymena malaccensis]